MSLLHDLPLLNLQIPLEILVDARTEWKKKVKCVRNGSEFGGKRVFLVTLLQKRHLEATKVVSKGQKVTSNLY